jgi:transposase
MGESISRVTRDISRIKAIRKIAHADVIRSYGTVEQDAAERVLRLFDELLHRANERLEELEEEEMERDRPPPYGEERAPRRKRGQPAP